MEPDHRYGPLRDAELAHHLGISTDTARRDVEALSVAGRLNRTRGAVSLPGAAVTGVPAIRVLSEEPADGTDAGGLTVGLVVPHASHYFGEVIRGVREAVDASGSRLVLGITGYVPGQDEVQARRLLDTGADGLLLAPGWMYDGTEENAPCLHRGSPTALLDRGAAAGPQPAEFDGVCTDHAAGAGLAVRHLAGLGHTGIALLAGTSATGVQVRAGYETALRSTGRTFPPAAMIDLPGSGADAAGMKDAAAQLAKAVDQGTVSAALVVGDTDAILLLQALASVAPGLRVPQDLALVAYDDEVAALSDLPLTTVAPPKYEVGQEAVRLLEQRVREQRGTGRATGARRHLALLPELRVRRSCGAAEEE